MRVTQIHRLTRQRSRKNEGNSDYEGPSLSLQRFNHQERNGLIRDLSLSIESSELLTCRSKEKNLLYSGSNIT